MGRLEQAFRNIQRQIDAILVEVRVMEKDLARLNMLLAQRHAKSRKDSGSV